MRVVEAIKAFNAKGMMWKNISSSG